MKEEIKRKVYQIDDCQKFLQTEIYIQQFDTRRVEIAEVTKHYTLFSATSHITKTNSNGN